MVTVDAPQGKNDVEATFKQAGEKVTGDVTTPMGTANFSGTLIKNQLTISYSIALQGQALEVKLAGTVDRTRCRGPSSSAAWGRRLVRADASRAAAGGRAGQRRPPPPRRRAASPTSPASGTWSSTMAAGLVAAVGRPSNRTARR